MVYIKSQYIYISTRHQIFITIPVRTKKSKYVRTDCRTENCMPRSQIVGEQSFLRRIVWQAERRTGILAARAEEATDEQTFSSSPAVETACWRRWRIWYELSNAAPQSDSRRSAKALRPPVSQATSPAHPFSTDSALQSRPHALEGWNWTA